MGKASLRLLLALLGVAVLGAVLVVLAMQAQQRARLQQCRNNLRELAHLAWDNRMSLDPEWRGRAFWKGIRELTHKTIRGEWLEKDPDPFVCPLAPPTGKSREDTGSISYLGPKYPGEELESGRPWAADRPGNHRDGGYVLLNGENGIRVESAASSAELRADVERWLGD